MYSTKNIEGDMVKLSILAQAVYPNEKIKENFSKIITDLSKTNPGVTFYIQKI